MSESKNLMVTTSTIAPCSDDAVQGYNLQLLVRKGESSSDNGYLVTSDLWIKAVINTEEKGPIEAVWKKGGEDTASRGDRVIWCHFYASQNDVTWGSQDNPDLFVKICWRQGGRELLPCLCA